jgi:DNA-binding NtrC family response regulator
VQIPPLRARAGDVIILARHFVERFCRELNKKPLLLAPATVDEMRSYAWPGNVRELQNSIERAVILCDGDTIHPRHLNLSFRNAPMPTATNPWDEIDLSGTMGDALRRIGAEVERRKIAQAMREAAGYKQRAADILQVSYKTLLQKLKDYGISDE